MSIKRIIWSAPSARFTCSSCARQRPSQSRRFTTNYRRLSPVEPQPTIQSTLHKKYGANFREKNMTLANYTLSILIGTLALSYISVPLYKTICQTMGWGGQPVKSKTHFGDPSSSPSSVVPVATHPRIRITFSSSVSSVLPWTFTPTQRSVYVRPGETALAFYKAENKGTEDLIGVATYSVTPGNVAPYFSKIQCFCFEEQRLQAGETVDMPVFFYIDPEFVNDPAVRKIETVTLHYTFFKAKYDKQGHMYPMPMKT